MLEWIAKPFGWIVLHLYNWIGNYGVAVILFALLAKLILLPFQLKSKKSMMRTSRMTPRLKELEKKYGNDRQKYQEEVSKLYKEEGVNPMSGCLWMLIPYPILLALYRAIRFPLTTMMGVASDLLSEGGAIYEKLTELGYALADYSTGRSAGTYEQIYQSQFITEHFSDFAGLSDKLQEISYRFLGLNLGQVPNIKFWTWDFSSASAWLPEFGLFLIPILSALLSLLSMKLSMASSPQTMDQQSQQKTMMLWMPLISLWICFSMPGVMGIYWIAQSVFAMIQEAVLNKVFNKQLDIEDADRIEREKARKAELEAKRRETERLKAEGATVVNKNTSRKKQQAAAAQKEAERKAAEIRAARAAKRGPQEIPPSQVGNRRYARGRAYVPDRYTNPEEAEAKTQAAEEENLEYDQEQQALAAAQAEEPTPETAVEETAGTELTEETTEEEVSEEESGTEPAEEESAEDAAEEPVGDDKEEPAEESSDDAGEDEPADEEPAEEEEPAADEPSGEES